MSCRTINKRSGRICLGDLDKYIKIINKQIFPDLTSFDESVDSYFQCWARVDTTSGSERFDGININNFQTTHTVYIHYTDNVIDVGDLVEISGNKNRYLRIESITNLNEDDSFIRLNCNETGNTENNASLL